MIPSPTPEHNFDDDARPSTELDEFWHRKYGEDEDGRLVRIAATEDVVQKGDATDVHLPSPSYWPIVLAVGLPIIGYGLIFNLWFAVAGARHRRRRHLRLGHRAVGRPRRRPPRHDDHDDHDGDDADAAADRSRPMADAEDGDPV